MGFVYTFWTVLVFGVVAFVTATLIDLRLEHDVRLRVWVSIFTVVFAVAYITLSAVLLSSHT